MPSEDFLTEAEEQKVINAISRAEKQTSAEIRVHIEYNCNSEPLERAITIFHDLGMDSTEQQNGVLIYIASGDHKAAIFAGEGIHSQVEENYWQDVLQILLNHFKKEAYEIGIKNAVTEVGLKLQELFPYQRGDVNELSDEISYNDNRDE